MSVDLRNDEKGNAQSDLSADDSPDTNSYLSNISTSIIIYDQHSLLLEKTLI